MIKKVRVNERLEYKIRRGFPWIFRKDADFGSHFVNGCGVAIYNKANRRVGFGLYDAYSPIAVRLLSLDLEFGRDYITRCLHQALKRREAYGIINAENNAFRVINGESEGLPAVIIDSYAGTWVLKLYSALWLPYINDMIEIILYHFAPQSLILRFSRASRDSFEAAGYTEGQLLRGEAGSGYVVFSENGLRFSAQVFKGQKTGFFLDQRDNRNLIRTLTNDCKVLDLCAFSGGFSLNAAMGGASEIWSVDADKRALALIEKHYEMNATQLASQRFRRVLQHSDVFSWLRKQRGKRRFDLVIADPPSFASAKSQVEQAKQAYKRLFTGAADCLRPGGQILCCSCSAHIGAELFEQIIKESLGDRIRSAQDYTALPFDHPASFAEARYLKTWLLQLR
ncbi:MAG: class I SAM-dependent rRNA methyltransferase [Bradymonadia bacterium]|jgi:23S rRNA (cytosine1962-C5)-methyltransferase